MLVKQSHMCCHAVWTLTTLPLPNTSLPNSSPTRHYVRSVPAYPACLTRQSRPWQVKVCPVLTSLRTCTRTCMRMVLKHNNSRIPLLLVSDPSPGTLQAQAEQTNRPAPLTSVSLFEYGQDNVFAPIFRPLGGVTGVVQNKRTRRLSHRI